MIIKMIYIEGNIGVGKTSLLNNLKLYHFNVITEPVEQWCEILKLYYNDKQKYAFRFQMKILLTWIEKFILLNNMDVYFTERSLFSRRDVFFKITCENGHVNDKDILEYHDCFDKLININCIKDIIKPKAYIYLKASPEICYERVKKRNRIGEEHITVEYIEKLDLYHQNWINKEREKGIQVFEIDNSFEYHNEEMYTKIIEFFKTE